MLSTPSLLTLSWLLRRALWILPLLLLRVSAFALLLLLALRLLRRLVEGSFPEVAVLTFGELDADLQIRPVGRLVPATR